MWKFCSENENTISLHDMIISKIKTGKDIEFVFKDGFAVTKENENNLTGKHKQTGKASVCLLDGEFTRGKNCDNNDLIGKNALESLIFEVLTFEWNGENQQLVMFGNTLSGKGDVLELYFSCTKILFYWNDFTQDAWFEKHQRR